MAIAYKNSDQLYWVKDNVISAEFPEVSKALSDPDGLLAIGGSLTIDRLIIAYQKGIFPWYNEGQPILWWSPNPRWVLEPSGIKISRSLRKTLRKNIFTVTVNRAFENVINACSAPRKDAIGTWITPELKKAFINLNKSGYAHSIECWHGQRLVGGLYGIAMGRIFFGESMFSKMNDASKVALVNLCRFLEKLDFQLIDCQVYTRHLESLGAYAMERKPFIDILHEFCDLSHLYQWQGKLNCD